jgi:hypothetical protein
MDKTKPFTNLKGRDLEGGHVYQFAGKIREKS